MIPDHHRNLLRMTQQHFLHHSLDPLPSGSAMAVHHRHLVSFHFPARMIVPDPQILRQIKKRQHSLRHSLYYLRDVDHETFLRRRHRLLAAGSVTFHRLKHQCLRRNHFVATNPDPRQSLLRMTQQHFLRHSRVPLPHVVDMTHRLKHRRFVFFHFQETTIGPDQQMLLRMKLRRFLPHSLDRLPAADHETSLRLKHRRFLQCNFQSMNPLICSLDPIPVRNLSLLQKELRRFPYPYASTYPFQI